MSFILKRPSLSLLNLPPNRRHGGRVEAICGHTMWIGVVFFGCCFDAVATKQSEQNQADALGKAGTECLVGHNLIFPKYLISTWSEEWISSLMLCLSCPSCRSGALHHSRLGSRSF